MRFLAIAAASVLATTSLAAADPLFKSFEHGARTLSGTFNWPTATGPNTAKVSVAMDLIDYRNGVSHKVYLKPEDYRLKVETVGGAPFQGNGYQLTCPEIAGPGLKGVAGGTAPLLECTWKAGNGAAPSGSFALGTLTAGSSEADPIFRRYVFGGDTLVGTFTWGPDNQLATVSVKVDLWDYRNGDSHKAWTKPEDYKLVVTNFSGNGFQINCPEIAGPGAKLVAAGAKPTIACTWKAGYGGSAPRGAFVLN